MWSLTTGFFHLDFKLHPHCNMYQYFTLFLWSNNTPLYKYTTFGLSIHQLMDIYIIFTFAIVNDDAMNICVQVLGGHMFSLLGVYIRVKLLGLRITLSLTFCQIVFQGDCTIFLN